MKNIPQHVLVTGATGGLGIAITRRFCEAGARVTATGRNLAAGERLATMGATFIPADLLDNGMAVKLCAGQQSIIHAAALSSSWHHPAAFDRANVEATTGLLAAAKHAGCSRFVYISSPSVYASLHDQIGITEQTPLAVPQLNDYARTKLAAEKLVLSANSPQMQTTAIRPRAIMGPDDKVLLPKMLQMLERSIIPLFRDGEALVELTDARDVAEAVWLAEQQIGAVAGQAINISGGVPLPMRALAQGMAQAANKSLRFLPIPLPIAKGIAHMSEWRGRLSGYRYEPQLTRYILSTMAYSKTFDLTFAKEKLGYAPAYDAFATLQEETRRRTL